MNKKCEDCGCTLNREWCPSCHEELIITDDQYPEANIPLPNKNSEFMQKAEQQRDQVKKKREYYNSDAGGTGHGDISWSDADPGL